MILLDYELSPEWDARASTIDLELADETALRYDLFLGDVLFTIDGADLSARWGWVPVLDFALGVRRAVRALDVRPAAWFEFTESNARIAFTRDFDDVRVEASYSPSIARAGQAELRSESERFLARVVADLRVRYPTLSGNTSLAELVARATGEG